MNEAIIEWSERLSVKVPSMDDEHKQLLILINWLIMADAQGRSGDALGGAIYGLLEYTQTHFWDEEQLLRSRSYPDYPRHKEMHDRFIRKVMELRAKYEAGEASPVELTRLVRDWLVNHIMTEDVKYGAFLSAGGDPGLRA